MIKYALDLYLDHAGGAQLLTGVCITHDAVHLLNLRCYTDGTPLQAGHRKEGLHLRQFEEDRLAAMRWLGSVGIDDGEEAFRHLLERIGEELLALAQGAPITPALFDNNLPHMWAAVGCFPSLPDVAPDKPVAYTGRYDF